jgi:HD superfamily phosphohydrolase YqeK
MTVSAEDAKTVNELIPEIALIENEKLRTAVQDIWAESWRESEWESLAEVPKNTELPADRKLVTHTRSVTRMCISAAENLHEFYGIEYDRDIVIAAAILHDVSKLFENELAADGVTAQHSRFGKLIQHGTYGAFKAWEKDLPMDLVHNIIVHTRGSRNQVQTWEALLVHYIDYLDSDTLLFTHGKKLLLTK